MICCNEYYFLGCYTTCDCYVLPDIIADQSGVWRVEYSYNYNSAVFSVEVVGVSVGEPLRLNNFKLNENSNVFLRIYRPDGSIYNLNEYECFILTVNFGVVKKDRSVIDNCNSEIVTNECECIVSLVLDASKSFDLYREYSIAYSACEPVAFKVTWDFGEMLVYGTRFGINFSEAGTYQINITPIFRNCVSSAIHNFFVDIETDGDG